MKDAMVAENKEGYSSFFVRAGSGNFNAAWSA
jgi:hypothetical protein